MAVWAIFDDGSVGCVDDVSPALKIFASAIGKNGVNIANIVLLNKKYTNGFRLLTFFRCTKKIIKS